MTPTAAKPRRRHGGPTVRHWTKKRVIAAVKRWEKKFGRPPTEADWNPARTKLLVAGSIARVQRAEAVLKEYGTGEYPSSKTLQELYDGKWAEGIKDAGFVPLPPGRPDKLTLSRYAKRADEADEVALLFCMDEVKKAMKDGTPRQRRQALMDLASIAATLAEEMA